MGLTYELVNHTRRELVAYVHIGAGKAKELTGNPVAAAITTWYLLQCRGDRIAFVSDEDDEHNWPFSGGRRADLEGYSEITDRLVSELIAAGILRDDGIEWADDDEPETCFYRALTNIWMIGDGG